jgi:rSAM-associated Gly-rich repeat protein
MTQDRRSLRTLAQLLPSGAFGLSVGLAAADASATATPAPEQEASVADRLQALRTDVSSAIEQYRKDGEPFVAIDPEQTLAWWGNGWHRGWGWRNGGWGNGGWGNGWHNGWGNGGWGNWHNGWHNGWHNW